MSVSEIKIYLDLSYLVWAVKHYNIAQTKLE